MSGERHGHLVLREDVGRHQLIEHRAVPARSTARLRCVGSSAQRSQLGVGERPAFFIKSEKLEDETIAYSPYGQYHGYEGLFGVSRDPRSEDIPNILAAYEEVGHDIVEDVSGNGTLGYGKPLLTIDAIEGYKTSSAYAYLRPAKHRKNLHVLTNILVTKILFDSQNRATGVEAISGENIYIFRAKKEVIISAGPVKSPQLLMLSGIGPREHLIKKGIKPIINLPVGENLQDHISVTLTFSLDSNPGACLGTCFDETFNPHIYTAPVYVGKVSLDKCNKNVHYTTVNYIVPQQIILPFCTVYYRYQNDICENLYNKTGSKRLLFVILTLARPKSKGCVTLDSGDPKDAPIIDPGYFSNEEDIKTMIYSIKDYMKIMKSSYFRKYHGKFLDVTCPRCKGKVDEEYWRCYILCMMKPMSQLGGSCAMGRVVDGRLRVRRACRLRLVDASVMPRITSDDTVAPTVMIAEKAAIMIQEDNSA